MKTLRVAIAQINSTVGDIKGNGDKIIEFMELARKESAELVIFPELTLTGYPPEDLLFKKSFIKANIQELKRVSKCAKDIYAIIGFVGHENSIYNSAALIHEGEIKGLYNKILLPNYGVFDEKRYFSPGVKAPVFVVEGIRTGITICEDIWFKNGPAYFQAKKGKAEVIINLSSSPYHIGKLNVRRKMISEVAKENGAYVVYANLVGGQDELVFDGASLIASPDGKIISMGKQFEEDLIVVDLLIKKSDQSKNKINTHNTDNIKKDPCYQELKKLQVPVIKISDSGKKILTPSELINRKIEPLQKMEEIFTALVAGVRDYILKNGFKKALIGLSGGIDSALTAVIAADAIGSDNVIGVTMPSVYSSKGSVTDSQQLAKNLGIEFFEIPISNIVNVYEKELYRSIGGNLKGITEENIQSRIRGDILMALSNNFNWLLLATGNKSEFSTGYCTLYGDMSGGFAAIKDVPKTLVFKLSEFRNKKAGFSLIPDSTLTKEPSAELRADQKDSDSLPPYPVLDEILQDYVEKDKDVRTITSKIKDRDLVRKVVNLVNRSEYKRRQGPPGVKITPRAFGKDRRYPIVNKFIEN